MRGSEQAWQNAYLAGHGRVGRHGGGDWGCGLAWRASRSMTGWWADMGTWGCGPFDNDEAQDWLSDLEDVDPSQRVEVIQEALVRVADSDGYLELSDGEVGLAAVAMLASRLSTQLSSRLECASVPASLAEEDGMEVTADLAALALRVLDRLMSDGSEWRDEWQATDDWPGMLLLIRQLREALSS